MSDFKNKLNKIKLNVLNDKLSEEMGKLLSQIDESVKVNTTLDTTKIKFIDDRFKQIDTINATTAIGTIEFIDDISKLNSISNSCFSLSKTTEQNEYGYIYKNVNNIK
jgi:predicted phosphatase